MVRDERARRAVLAEVVLGGITAAVHFGSWTLLTCWLAVAPCSRTSVAPGTLSVENTVTPSVFGEPGSRSE